MKSNRVLANHFRIALTLTIAGCALCIASCDNNNQPAQTPPTQNSTTNTVLAATPAPDPAAKTPPKTIIYKVGTAPDGMANLQPVEIDGEPKDSDTAVKAINEMAALKESPLPKDAKALSVKFEDSLATVDFNKAFSDNFPGGDRKEALVFNALTSTLGQFPKVKKIQILVEGEKVPVGGTQDTREPLDVAPANEQVANHTAP